MDFCRVGISFKNKMVKRVVLIFIILVICSTSFSQNFSENLDYLKRLEDPNLDSNWLNFIKNADKAKAVLTTIKLNEINSVHTIRLMVRDTFLKAQRENNEVGMGIISPYGWVDGWMTMSTPILSRNKDKAIIEISYVRGELDGNGGVLFLEKRKDDEWIVIQHLRTWIS